MAGEVAMINGRSIIPELVLPDFISSSTSNNSSILSVLHNLLPPNTCIHQLSILDATRQTIIPVVFRHHIVEAILANEHTDSTLHIQ